MAEHGVTAPLPDAIDSRLDRMLAGMEWELRRSRRSRVTDGAVSTVLRDTAGFVFLHDGRAAVRAAADRGWTPVAAGDLVLVPRHADLTVRGDGGAEATVVELTRPPAGRPDEGPLPDAVVARSFGAAEPGMAALVRGMACGWSTVGGAVRSGDTVICSRIATTIAVTAVRMWVEQQPCCADRWLSSALDPRIGRALRAVHADLTRAWTVADMAREATMSRAAFAERFTELVGRSPAGYLTAVRVGAGRELLADDTATVAEVAHRVGYRSELGFARAFRREAGMSPSQWRASARSVRAR